MIRGLAGRAIRAVVVQILNTGVPASDFYPPKRRSLHLVGEGCPESAFGTSYSFLRR
jgi:hypothetical protein